MNGEWWKEIKGQVHADCLAVVKKIKERQQYRKSENLRYVRLYGNLEVLGITSALYSRPSSSALNNRVTLNVIQSCVDTAAAKIAKNRPKPKFLTSGGDWKKQQKAKKLGKFIDGQFYAQRIYEKTSKTFIDAGIFGSGIIKICSQDGEIYTERVIPDEIVVDDYECIYGEPRNLYQEKAISRDVLLEKFPKYKTQIDALPSASSNDGFMTDNHSNLVQVVEGWHLPASAKSGDGRHVLCIDGADLLDEKWDRLDFPFRTFRLNEKPFGWWGQGFAEQLVGIQIEINKLLRNIQVAHHLLSAPAYMVELGSKIVKTHLNNDIGRVVTYSGVKPSIDVFQTIHPEIYQHLERLYQKAYEIVGISQLSAQSKKPSGLDSGKALREFNDIESERFMLVGQRWEQFHLDIADAIISEARRIYGQDKDLEVKVKGKSFIETIKWSEVDMPEDSYIMQVFPVSSLPSTPAGKMAFVQELMQGGVIDPDLGTELLEFPDLERALSLKAASKNVVRQTLGRILEDGEYTAPEPFQDLQYSIDYAQMFYNQAKLENAPEDRLELIRRYIEHCMILIEQMTPEPAPAPLGMAPELQQPMPTEEQLPMPEVM